MALLYCKEPMEQGNVNLNQHSWKILEYTPSLKQVFLTGEAKTIKTALVRLYFQIMTYGKAKLICAINDCGEVMHTSYLVPRCFKFCFLDKNDFEVGPCYTNPNFRGKGIYPAVLDYICSNYGNKKTMFYMIVDDNNVSSIRGIEKAGFRICGRVKKSYLFKRYHLLFKTEGEKNG